MKLHRAEKQPDWELVSVGQRSNLQVLAARTEGIVTPGNALSLIGLLLVIAGLLVIYDSHLWPGIVLVGVGRICDLIDGVVAEQTKTKSPLGEGVDATFDKIAALASLVVFGAKNIIPWPFALVIGLENLGTSVLALGAKHAGRPIHPVPVGKVGGAVEWIAFLAFILGAAIHGHSHDILTIVGYILAAAAIAMNGIATINYAQVFFERRGR